MDKKIIIGIMGPGSSATDNDLEVAFELGKLLAENHYYVLIGGRASGVMEAAMKGAKSAGGTTLGILPSENGEDQSEFVDIPIKTGMGSARNNINVLTADVVIGVGIGPGTASEIALAIKAQKPILLLNQSPESISFFQEFRYKDLVITNKLEELLKHIDAVL
ncbi:MAG: TIGR00725 family protein [Gracilimonas sp.]|uniref:TIGR00725 family protein n=1 Tax=Gracilimonas TaxID=649462 RepID=UPI001B2EA364|nr:TIGR00725 family protein [Gracilimonas sp.]MBO6585408.1 TIGR00725 family protein [Gracilimonas sp.]MBO6616404.1 TIGR00725 family protein [Gracilimonas sp.]